MAGKTPKADRIDRWYVNDDFSDNYSKIKWSKKEDDQENPDE